MIQKIQIGVRARDSISGFEGTIVGRTEYITGCEQFLLIPTVDEKGAYREGHWFDVDRLEALSELDRSLTVTKAGPDLPAPIK